jgi:hypothetical protein
VPTKSILKAANMPIIGGHHVLALQSSPEGWQATPLLERCREHAGRPGVVQRHVLYLGEINDTQELAWRRSIAVLEDGAGQPRTLSLFPEDRYEGLLTDASIVGVKLSEFGCVGRGNGARAGWRCCCGGNCSSISSGASGSA